MAFTEGGTGTAMFGTAAIPPIGLTPRTTTTSPLRIHTQQGHCRLATIYRHLTVTWIPNLVSICRYACVHMRIGIRNLRMCKRTCFWHHRKRVEKWCRKIQTAVKF